MNKRFWLLLALWLTPWLMVQAQTAPPYLTMSSATGAQRGTTITFTVDGYNLNDAREVLWSHPGITSRITLNSELMREPRRKPSNPADQVIQDKATKNQLTLETAITTDVAPGLYSFRIRTPLGTTNLQRFFVGLLPETKERERSDSAQAPQMISLPGTIIGDLQTVGDHDSYRFKARAGQQLVFEIVAAPINSKLDSVLTLFDDQGRPLASNNDFNRSKDSLLAFTVAQDGEYVIRVSDLERKGQEGQYFYRLNAGELPYLTHVFPLGVPPNVRTEVSIYGFNLGSKTAHVIPPQAQNWREATPLVFESERGQALNTLKVAVGQFPEIREQTTPTSLNSPQNVSLPATINGRIFNEKAATDEDVYRFKARKGQHLVLEVEAQAYGSPLDSVIEVLDVSGKPIPRLQLRCLLESQLVLNDRDSAARGFRIGSWNGIFVNDYILAGNELLQVDVLPKTPDEDISFKSFQGQRLGLEDTTPEAHANGATIYKVSLHAPGVQLPPNGLPVVTLFYRNDDGGPLYGKDARLNFVAPADGEYLVRIRDVRGWQGQNYAYRLSLHEPTPDFVLFVDPENPNVPRGGSLPINVTAYRRDGFAGDIEVKLLDLPPGFSATSAVIPAGQMSTVLRLSAGNDANAGFPLQLQASTVINGKPFTRIWKAPERVAVVSVAAPPELLVWTSPAEVVLEPGGAAFVDIRIKREGTFAGRVPFDIRNLPPGVIVTDVGLNGVMITEQETTQRFRLAAEPWVKPLTQSVFVVGRIETTSPQRADFPAQPFTLVVKTRETASQTTPR